MTDKTCRTCACVIEAWSLRREACYTCAHREPGWIEYCEITGEEIRRMTTDKRICDQYLRAEHELHSACRYPLHGPMLGGASVWETRSACSQYVEAPPEKPEQMELAL